MIGELETRYEVPHEIARALVKDDQILPLLDGLDEVAEDHRASCLAAINVYRKTCPSVSMVVCSRKHEYDVRATLLALDNAVYIQPLTQEQIDAYLESAGSHLEAVRRALREDAGLQELTTTPLWLSVLTLAYQGRSVEDILGAPLEKQRHLIFEKYVERMLARRAKARWTPEEIQHWLVWLAGQMKEHSMTVFSLESITPDWFATFPMRLAQMAGSPSTLRWVGEEVGSFVGARAGGGAGGRVGGTVGKAVGGVVGEAVGGDAGKSLGQTVGWFIGAVAGETGTRFVGALTAGIIGQIGGEQLVKMLLWKAGVGPKNYIDFLDYAADHILLRKVGEGTYIFVHQLLQDYFASLAVPPTLDDTSSSVNEAHKHS